MIEHPPVEQPRSITHSGFEQRFLARLKRAVTDGASRIIVGFSGGADSLALAAVLARTAPLVGATVALLYVDHRLRPDSSAEAERAAALASALDIPFRNRAAPDHPQRLHPHVGIEEAARRVRYVAFAETASDMGFSAIALAHHQDDQAETVLLHLLRGAGLSGASAMREISTITVPWWISSRPMAKLRIWRPFLHESRADVRAYAARTGLSPIEDASNDDLTLRRNRIRHDLMPVLKRIDADVSNALARYARIAAEEDALLDELAANAMRDVSASNGGLQVTQLRALPFPLQRRIIRDWLRQLGAPAEVSLERIDATIAATERRRGGATIEISHGWRVTVQDDLLRATVDVRGGDQQASDIVDPVPETDTTRQTINEERQ